MQCLPCFHSALLVQLFPDLETDYFRSAGLNRCKMSLGVANELITIGVKNKDLFSNINKHYNVICSKSFLNTFLVFLSISVRTKFSHSLKEQRDI